MYPWLPYVIHCKKDVKELLDNLTDVQCKYPFVDCFSNVSLFSFNGNVCATKGKPLDVVVEVVELNQHLSGI